MKGTRIFFFVFLITAIAAAYYLITSIDDSIQQANRIREAERAVINQLEMIREAEMAYVTTNGRYTADWDSLINFLRNGVFYITEKEEKIFELSYGVDSVVVTIDTLGTVPVYDSLFGKKKNFNLDRLPYVPVYKNVKFGIEAGKIEKSGKMIDVIEVWNPKPVNPERKEDSEYRSKKPLRFGSQFSVTTSGNWE
jgi:hypothetical protein